jgi:peptidoglycan/LPS O-acetylase OafA/YrhL
VGAGGCQLHRLANIQGLRFIAALSVVLFHCDGFYRALRGVPLSQTFEYVGYSGVDIFFVISGAVMVLSTASRVGIGSSAKFLYARFVRVMPLYWIMFGLMWVVVWSIRRSDLETLGMIDGLLLWPIKTYFVPDAWTLTYEMIFYGFFAVLVLFPFAWRLPAVILMSVASLVICATWGARSVHPFISIVFFLEFFGGCAAAFLWLAVDGRGFRSALAIAAALFVLAVVLQSWSHQLFMEEKRVLVFGPASVALVYGLLGCETRWRVIFPHRIVQAGDWSYSIYLFHPVALFFYAGLDPTRALDGSAWSRSVLVALGIAAILVVACTISAWVELPLYAALRRLPDRVRSLASRLYAAPEPAGRIPDEPKTNYGLVS